ncbi:MAG: type II toxin-antitoxin system VapC family toxin [Candidatus Nanopelagicales bacterium]
MRLLLDSHIVLWWLDGQAFDQTATAAIAAPSTDVAVSVASVWEISLKQSLGKLQVDGDLSTSIAEANFDVLPIEARHACQAATLPFHHRDPFDRMLVVQAQIEGRTIVTRDSAFDRYDVPVLWA